MAEFACEACKLLPLALHEAEEAGCADQDSRLDGVLVDVEGSRMEVDFAVGQRRSQAQECAGDQIEESCEIFCPHAGVGFRDGLGTEHFVFGELKFG